MSHYSRRTYIHHPCDLERGDLVDVSATLLPCWATVDRVGTCADDSAGDGECDDGCDAVIFFVDPDDFPWHVGDGDEIYARLAADATAADVDAENDAHDARFAGV